MAATPQTGEEAEYCNTVPTAQAEVNHWQVLNADEEVTATGTPFQIEAGFHFKVNGEYYGGYLRSVAMTHHEAEMKSKGEPKVNVRYNPANPDESAVLAEDNAGTLPFGVVRSRSVDGFAGEKAALGETKDSQPEAVLVFYSVMGSALPERVFGGPGCQVRSPIE